MGNNFQNNYRVPTQLGKPWKMTVHLENLQILSVLKSGIPGIELKMIFHKAILLLKLEAYCGHILWCIHQGKGLKERMFSGIKTANSSNFVDVTSYGVRSPRLQLRWSSLFIVSGWIIFTLPRTWNDWHEVNQSNFWL